MHVLYIGYAHSLISYLIRCLDQNPTLFPSTHPTERPTPLPYCPPAYDPNEQNYEIGAQVSVVNYIHECAGGKLKDKAYIYEPYCSISDISILDGHVGEIELWNEAWQPVSACYTTETPTITPSIQPTEWPTLSPTWSPVGGLWYPDLYVEQQRCVQGHDYPHWMSLSSNTKEYLFDTRDDCCAEHFCEETMKPTRKPSRPPSRQPSKSPSRRPSDARKLYTV